MKWLEVHDPELNGRLRYVTSEAVEMILPLNGNQCFVTFKDRGKQWKVQMSAGKLMAYIDQ